MTLEQRLEGVLFYKAEPMKKAALAKLLEVDSSELETALEALKKRLDGAIRLIVTDDTIELALAPELDTEIEKVRKEELKRDIGKAGAETLAIVLYRGPVSRSEIDYIRGVNSAYILRNLEIRGLIERNNKGRQVEFRATTELLRHLGVGEKTELTNYQEVMDTLENYEEQMKTET